jgi:curved DNA-binding protein CbpA
MRLKRNYYEVMGLSRNATPLEVKQKYHQLARQFHPDRASDKELATRLFSQINLAYRTLSDEGRRSLYDAGLQSDEIERNMRQNGGAIAMVVQPQYGQVARGTPSGAVNAGQFGGQPRVSVQVRPAFAAQAGVPTEPSVQLRPGMAGQPSFGPAASGLPLDGQASPSRPTPTATLAGADAPAPPNAATLADWLDEANRAYFRNDRSAAAAIVNKLLKYQYKNPEVYRLAGDIYADTGRRKEALLAYKRGLALQAGNFQLQEKINRLQASLAAASNGQDTPAEAQASAQAGAAQEKPAEKERPSLLRRILGGSR